MFKNVIVGKKGTGSLYGASKTSATVNTALTPDVLRNGSVGIYGLQGVDAVTAGNTGKWVLITNATNATGKAAKNNFTGTLIRICVGVDAMEEGFVQTALIDKSQNFSVWGKASEAYVKQLSYIGYSPGSSAGKLNLTELADVNDEIGFKTHMKLEGAYDSNINEISIQTYQDESVFDMLSRLVIAANADSVLSTKFTFGITNNASNDTDPTEDLDIVQGSADATMENAGDAAYAVGAYIKISDNVYKIIAVASDIITFDRPVEEATATIAAASVNILDVTEFPASGYSEWGISAQALVDNEVYSFSLLGLLENATIDYYQATSKGSGLYAEVLDMEVQARPYRGNMHTADVAFLTATNTQIPQFLSVSSSVYDVYFVKHGRYLGEKDYAVPQNAQDQLIAVAFEVDSLGGGAGDISTHNQADFEDIMTEFYAATSQIST